jgi:hypothetical protein
MSSVPDFAAIYKDLIPDDAELDTTFPDDRSYATWDVDEPFQSISTLVTPIHHWVGSEMYKIQYAIKWSLYNNTFDAPKLSDCDGDKCRRYKDPSLDDWCTACHGDPDDIRASAYIKLIITGAPFDDTLLFRHLSYFDEMIDSVTVISVERVADPDRLGRFHTMLEDIDNRKDCIAELAARLERITHKTTTLSEQMAELETFLKTGPSQLILDILQREKGNMMKSSAVAMAEKLESAATLALQQIELDTLHTKYGFESHAALETFLVDIHTKTAADNLAKARAKLGHG